MKGKDILQTSSNLLSILKNSIVQLCLYRSIESESLQLSAESMPLDTHSATRACILIRYNILFLFSVPGLDPKRNTMPMGNVLLFASLRYCL